MTSQLTRNAVVVLALLAAGFFAAYLRFRDHLGVSGVYSDGAHEWRPVQEGGELRYAVWDTPEALDALNGDGPEGRPAASPDGRLVVFAAGERGLNADLFAAEALPGGAYGPPRPLSAINGPFDELAPSFADGYLYFASDRPGGAGGLDLWRAPYSEDGGFGAPERLGGGVNTDADETDPAPRGAGAVLVFASDRARRGGFDLYRAAPDPDRSGATVVSALETLNSAWDEREPAWADGGRTLFLASDRPGGAGGHDLYKSAWHGGGWLEPRALDGLNTAASERAPAPSFDGFSLLFTRAPSEDLARGDLYRARSIELYRLPGRPVGWLDLILLLALLLLALLAWLARRWPTLDVLWKCLLVSLLVHLAIVWLLQYLYVEPEVYELPGDDRRIRVRLLDDASRLAGLRERGGSLEAERVAPEELRLAARSFEAEPVALPAPEPAAAMESPMPRTSELAEDRAPARTARAEPLPAAAESMLADGRADVRDAPEPFERRSGTTAEPALRPATVVLARAEVADGAARPASASRRTRAETELADGPRPSHAPEASFALRTEDSTEDEAAPPIEPLLVAHAPGAPERAPAELRDAPATPRAESRTKAPGPSSAAPADLVAGLLDAAPLAREASARAPGPAGPARFASGASSAASYEARPAPRAVELAARTGVADDLPRDAERALERPGAPWDRTPYQARSGARKELAIERYGGSEETERAVRGGLEYLARVQHRRGHWGRAERRDDKYGQVAVGKTGLCLLAFLGAGHTHQSGTEYSDVVRRALEFLLAEQRRGGHFGEGSAYSHGIATYAVAEAYALTQDSGLRRPLEDAVDQVLRHQDRRPDPRTFGGWSYYYEDDRTFDAWPRVSISAWQVMALESARLGGIGVPDYAFEDAREFLVHADDPRQPYFRYSHDPDRLRSGYPTLPASTPAALFALSLLGEDVDAAAYARERAFVLDRAPRGYRFTTDDAFVFQGQGNLYFWYYGTLATFRIGGNAWTTWNEAMKATLVPAQASDGSWRPIDIYAERFAGDGEGDRSYTTALCVLSLEVYYRYYLPLLRVR